MRRRIPLRRSRDETGYITRETIISRCYMLIVLVKVKQRKQVNLPGNQIRLNLNPVTFHLTLLFQKKFSAGRPASDSADKALSTVIDN